MSQIKEEPMPDYWMVRDAVMRAARDKDDDTLEFLYLEYPDIVKQMEREIVNKLAKQRDKDAKR